MRLATEEDLAILEIHAGDARAMFVGVLEVMHAHAARKPVGQGLLNSSVYRFAARRRAVPHPEL
jgi:hypothetical protein